MSTSKNAVEDDLKSKALSVFFTKILRGIPIHAEPWASELKAKFTPSEWSALEVHSQQFKGTIYLFLKEKIESLIESLGLPTADDKTRLKEKIFTLFEREFYHSFTSSSPPLKWSSIMPPCEI